MKRRHFLSFAGFGAGSCLVPAVIARRIHDVCIGASQPLILAPDHAHSCLYAEESYGNYILHLGDPNAEPDYPTLREFIEDRGFDPYDDDDLRRYVIEWQGLAEDFDEEEEGGVSSLYDRIDQPINESERDHWMEWNFEMREGTMPKAYHYLSGLPLINSESLSGFDFGELSFIEGDRPGSNLTYCTASSLAALASLQHRLNELNQDIAIKMHA